MPTQMRVPRSAKTQSYDESESASRMLLGNSVARSTRVRQAMSLAMWPAASMRYRIWVAPSGARKRGEVDLRSLRASLGRGGGVPLRLQVADHRDVAFLRDHAQIVLDSVVADVELRILEGGILDSGLIVGGGAEHARVRGVHRIFDGSLHRSPHLSSGSWGRSASRSAQLTSPWSPSRSLEGVISLIPCMGDDNQSRRGVLSDQGVILRPIGLATT